MTAITKLQPLQKELAMDPVALKRLADFLMILFQIEQQGKKTMEKDV
jgi:hypothetical protein